MEIQKTERGFSIGKFYDRTNELCSIQESSIATEPCIWLGCNIGQRMHLTIDNVKDLLPLLQRFVDTGKLINPLQRIGNLGNTLENSPQTISEARIRGLTKDTLEP